MKAPRYDAYTYVDDEMRARLAVAWTRAADVLEDFHGTPGYKRLRKLIRRLIERRFPIEIFATSERRGHIHHDARTIPLWAREELSIAWNLVLGRAGPIVSNASSFVALGEAISALHSAEVVNGAPF